MGLLEELLFGRAMGESRADTELNRQGSVMGSAKQNRLPDWRQQLPQTLGPTAGTAAQAGLNLLDALLQFGPSPLDAAGAQSAVMVPAARVFHGTPAAYHAVDLGKAAPGIGRSHFVTTSPALASEYARGAISDAGRLAEQYAPNVRPYQMRAHRSLVTDMPIEEGELAGVLKAVEQRTFAPKAGKHGTVTPDRQRANAMANIESQVLPGASPGQQLRDVLDGMFGVDESQEILKKAGFKSVQYKGEDAAVSGAQQATRVLDMDILEPYVDYLAKALE